jgi:hypothetical protein
VTKAPVEVPAKVTAPVVVMVFAEISMPYVPELVPAMPSVPLLDWVSV